MTSFKTDGSTVVVKSIPCDFAPDTDSCLVQVMPLPTSPSRKAGEMNNPVISQSAEVSDQRAVHADA